ncbi:FAR1-related sequence 5-like protein [Tanacetum coccineum]
MIVATEQEVVSCTSGRWLFAAAGGGWLQCRLQEGVGFVAPVWRDELKWNKMRKKITSSICVNNMKEKNTLAFDSSGFKNEVNLRCDRSGQYKEKESSKDTATRKINCPFMLVGKYSWVYNGWTLSVMCDEHNHPPVQHMEAHPYARRLTTDEYRLVEDWTRKNVEARNILAILKEQNKDNVSTIKDIYNAQSKIHKAKKVGETTMQNLMSLLHTQGYVHDHDTHPLTNELEALFFVHPSSFKIWCAFPHVLIIYATYKTNIYKRPYVEIVGITSTSKTFCIAFAFISEEKEKNYKWVLERLKLTLKGCMLPRVIITDRELVLIGEYIPLDSVDIFWRTLNVSWSEQVDDDDIQCEDVMHRFKEKFSE